MWPLLLSLLAGTVLSLTLCGQDRKQTNVKASAGKSSRSGKTKKAGVSGSMKTQSKSLKKSGKSGKKKTGTSSKSSKTGKSSKSIKSGKVRVAEMTEKVNKRRSARNSAKEKSLSASISKDGSTKSAKLKKKSDSSRSLKRQKSIDSSAKTVAVVELRADPPEITLLRAGGLQKFKFINESSARRAFKVKCSDNQLYRVSPVYGIVEPGSFATIQVLRSDGSPKVDKLVLLTSKVGQEDVKPRDLMANAHAISCQVTVVPLFVDA